MGCLFAMFAGLFPRLALFILWIARPARIDAAFDTFLWPLLGIIFLPFATLMYVLLYTPVEVWSGGTGSGSYSPPCWTLAIGLPAPPSATSSPAGAAQPPRSSDQDARPAGMAACRGSHMAWIPDLPDGPAHRPSAPSCRCSSWWVPSARPQPPSRPASSTWPSRTCARCGRWSPVAVGMRLDRCPRRGVRSADGDKRRPGLQRRNELAWRLLPGGLRTAGAHWRWCSAWRSRLSCYWWSAVWWGSGRVAALRAVPWKVDIGRRGWVLLQTSMGSGRGAAGVG